MAVLQFHAGDRALFRQRISQGRTILGRSDRCDIVLPSDRVSRVHCSLERRADGWCLVDRSSSGTLVEGVAVSRHTLSHGDRFELGPYRATFLLNDEHEPDSATATTVLVRGHGGTHEEVVEILEDGVAATHAVLHHADTSENRRYRVNRPRISVGGKGADISIDSLLPENAMRLRVARGRVMVEPGEVPVFLTGTRVRVVTPVYPGEVLTLGKHRLVVEMEVTEQSTLGSDSFGGGVGGSPVMRRLFGVLNRMAMHDAPVLLIGASGTGKELAAKGLHDRGPRASGAFVTVNCAAITETLFESEFFGHEKGAFTGASKRRDGAFSQADGGTLFLDEIGELKLDAQAKLLRTLESGEVRRVGATGVEYPDVRVVTATNRDLAQMVQSGSFRADLYFRLNVLSVRIPALKERREDIPLLVQTLLANHLPGATVDDAGMVKLVAHNWPGNIRELKNVLTRAFVLHGPVISAGSVSFDTISFPEKRTRAVVTDREEERARITEALTRHGGNRTHTARELGMPRSSLIYKIGRYGIEG
jgi:DNA-binding NtrC family response regulator